MEINKMKKSSIFILFLILMTFITGCSVKKVQELTDAEKFSKEFGISKENPFVYTTIDHILNLFENNGKALIFFANSDEEGSIKAASYIANVAQSENVKRIYYYNPKKLSEKNEKKYNQLLEYMEMNPKSDQFILPNLFSIQNGKIVSNCSNFSQEKELSEEYLTKKKVKKIKDNYKKVLTYQECEDYQ